MPTVRLRDASEYPEAAQRMFELSKAWFNYDFAQPAAMSRVMAWDGGFGAPHGRRAGPCPGQLKPDSATALVSSQCQRSYGPLPPGWAGASSCG